MKPSKTETIQWIAAIIGCTVVVLLLLWRG